MTEKGVTIERSPSGLGMGMFSPHLGGGGSWDQQQNAIITKITPTNAPTARINTDNQEKEKEKRRKKSGEKSNVGRACGCGGWIRAGQLEHDLAELKTTHNSLLAGLHVQIESLKQKNRDLTFQLLMGPYAGGVKTDVPLSPESDEATSPKNDVPSKPVDNNKAKKETTSSTSLQSSTLPVTSSSPNAFPKNASVTMEKEEPKLEKLSEENVTNGDVTVVRRKLRGRSGRGDPRLVRSLDLEILEEEAHHTRILLEEERAKNKYLSTLVDDLKRSSERDGWGTTTLPSITAPRYQVEQQQQQQQQQSQQQQQQQQHRGRGRQYGRGRTRQRQHQQQHERHDTKGAINGELPVHQTQSRGGEGQRPASLTRGTGGARNQYHSQRDDSRGRSETTAQPGPSGRDSSQGNRGGRHGRDGSVGDGGGSATSNNHPSTATSSSSALADQKRGLQNTTQEQEGRPENRQKRNGRGHRRAGRGRPRKDKHNVSAEVSEGGGGGEHHHHQ